MVRNKGYFTAASLAAFLQSTPSAVAYWVRREYFDGIKPRLAVGGLYQISHEKVWDWLSDMSTWHLWCPERIVDRYWREHFVKVRAGWLNTEQVAQRIYVTQSGVHNIIRRGALKAVRTRDRYLWVRVEDVEQYWKRANK